MNDIEKSALYDFHQKSNHKIILSYKGPFEQPILNKMADYIAVKLINNPNISERMLRIFVELAQVVSYYSSERNVFDENDAGIGALVIIETSDSYILHCGNIIKKINIGNLIEKCEHINSLDTNGLREYKNKQLDITDSLKDNVNIGLIRVAITSAKPLGMKISDFDNDNSFFAITVDVDK